MGCCECLQIVGDRFGGGDGVLGIVAGEHLEQEGGVLHGSRDGADGVHGIGGGHHAARADAAVGGLEADHAAVRAGNADRAAIVTADRAEAEPGGDRGGGAGRRSAGDAVEIPGIVGGAEAAGGAGAGECHLIQVQLAEEDDARGLQAPGDLCVFGGDSILEDLRGRRGEDARGVDVVLEGDGNAVQAAGDAPGLALTIALAGLRQRGVRERP